MPDLSRELDSWRALVLPLHVGSTLAMVGVIWIVQLVHYPLMARVGQAGFANYQRAHVKRITWVVGPLMLVEVATALALVLEPPTWIQASTAWIGLGLVTIVWIATAVFSVPLHGRLERGWDANTHHRLVATNWIRTLAWTARGVLVLTMIPRVH